MIVLQKYIVYKLIIALWCGLRIAFNQVCHKMRLKGSLECKLMLMFCVGIVHTYFYNGIMSDFGLFDNASILQMLTPGMASSR